VDQQAAKKNMEAMSLLGARDETDDDDEPDKRDTLETAEFATATILMQTMEAANQSDDAAAAAAAAAAVAEAEAAGPPSLSLKSGDAVENYMAIPSRIKMSEMQVSLTKFNYWFFGCPAFWVDVCQWTAPFSSISTRHMDFAFISIPLHVACYTGSYI
jgi:uncharacterized protein YccT (UPF0319 family)